MLSETLNLFYFLMLNIFLKKDYYLYNVLRGKTLEEKINITENWVLSK